MSVKSRVQAILERYTEYFEPEVLKAELYTRRDSTKTLVLLTPKQFQRLAFPLSYGEKHQAKTLRTDEHAGQWNELPYLRVKVDLKSEEALVIGHEGRHRTIYMQSRDLTKIPVVLWIGREKVKAEDGTKTLVGDKMCWGTDAYRPKLLRSQNTKWVMPMPHSIAYPKL